MNLPLARRFLLCFALLLPGSALASDWLVFQSDRGFSVEYPAGWYRLGSSSGTIDTEALDIISSPNQVHGVIIGHGDEMIAVFEIKDQPVEGYLDHFLKAVPIDPADSIISVEKNILISDEKDRCSTIAIVASRSEVGPKTYELQKHIFCPVGARLFMIATWRWEDSPARADTPEIMMRMVKSLRVSEQK